MPCCYNTRMSVQHHLRDLFNMRSNRAGFFPVAEDAAPVISAAQAVAVFDDLRAMQNIAHTYTDDGCAERAHLMCRKLLEMKLVPEKAWAFETPKRDLVVDFAQGQQIWWFHVAPVLRVDTGAGVVPMVFDTCLFDGPATLGEWMDVMKAESTQVQLTPCGRSPRGYHGDYKPYRRTGHATDAAAEKVMQDYLQQESEQPFAPDAFPSALRRHLALDAPKSAAPAAVSDTSAPPRRGMGGGRPV